MKEKIKAIQITDESKLQNLRSVLMSDIIMSESNFATIFAEIENDRIAYNAVSDPSDALWKGAPQITQPLIKTSALSLKSEVFPTLLDTNLIMRVETIQKKLDRYANALERFNQELYKRINYRKIMQRGIDAAIRDRVSIIGIAWETKSYKAKHIKREESEVIDEFGKQYKEIVESYTDKEQVYYDYPELSLIDIKNFRVFPSFDADIQESPGIGIIGVFTGYELIQLIEDGVFDKTNTESVLRSPQQTIEPTPEDVRDNIQLQQNQRIQTDKTGDLTVFGTQKYELIDVYYKFEKNRDWLITMDTASYTVLRAVPTPWWGHSRKFVAIRPYANENGLFGESIATLGGAESQDALSQALSLGIAQVLRQVLPRFYTQMQFMEHMNKLKNKNDMQMPGAFVPIPQDMNPDDMRVAEMTSNTTSLIPYVNMINDFNQNNAGINDVIQGGTFAGNTTATETLATMEGAKRKLGLVTTNIADSMNEIQVIMHELLPQFCNRDMIKKLWDDVVNSELHDDEERIEIEEALEYEYDFVANGSFATSKMIKAKKADEVMGMVIPMLDMLGLSSEKYDLMVWGLGEKGIKNAEALMGEKKLWVMMNDAMRKMQGMPTVMDVLNPPPPPEMGLPGMEMPEGLSQGMSPEIMQPEQMPAMEGGMQ